MNTSRQTGVSMVEILIASAVGLFLTAGVIQLFVSSKQAYRAEEGFSRLQENGRYALDVVARDLRMHGNMGCGPVQRYEQGDGYEYNSTDSETYWGTFNILAGPVRSLNAGGIGSSFPLGYRGSTTDSNIRALVNPDSTDLVWSSHTDALVVSGVFQKGYYLAQDMAGQDEWSSPLTLDTTDAQINPGELMVITDCRNLDLFQVTRAPASDTGTDTSAGETADTSTSTSTSQVVIRHDSASGANASAQLSTIYRKHSGVSINAMVFPFSLRTYFVGKKKNVTNAVPTLYVSNMEPVSGTATRVVRELVENVDDLVIEFYGDDADDDGTPDGYERADAVSDWSEVVAARIQLLVRSPEEVATSRKTFTFDGTSYTDRYQREVYATTVALRGRAEWRMR